MVDLESNTVKTMGKTEKIIRWEVWFWTIKGLFPSLEAAIESAREIDFPVEMVKPVPVAIGETIYEPM